MSKLKPEDPNIDRAQGVSVLLAKHARPDWWASNMMEWEHLVTKPHWRHAKPLLRVDPDLVSVIVERMVAGRPPSDSESEAWLCLGMVRYHREDYAAALEAFSYLLNRREDIRAVYNCGRCHERLGRRTEALAAYQQILALKPGDERALAALEALDL